MGRKRHLLSSPSEEKTCQTYYMHTTILLVTRYVRTPPYWYCYIYIPFLPYEIMYSSLPTSQTLPQHYANNQKSAEEVKVHTSCHPCEYHVCKFCSSFLLLLTKDPLCTSPNCPSPTRGPSITLPRSTDQAFAAVRKSG